MVQKESLGVLIITGPTGIGKSGVAIKVAKELNGEIISADSMQIYKGMDIGTGKVTPEEQSGVRHHLLDIVMPDQSFTVSDYRKAADSVVEEIISRNKLPIMAGGTGLYIKGFLYDYCFGVESDFAIRNKYEELFKTRGNQFVYTLLEKLDPESAKKIHSNDVKRIIRALEILEISGVKKSEMKNGDVARYDNFTIIALTSDREKIYEKINSRVDYMIECGLLNEVNALIQYRQCNSMQAIGYKELLSYISGKITFADAVELIKKNSRNYAKRQLTFLRKMDVIWLDIEKQDIVATITDIIQNLPIIRSKQ